MNAMSWKYQPESLMTWCGWKIGTAGRVQKINLDI